MQSHDETLSTFSAMTGLEGSEAESFLQAVNWNLVDAAQLFFASSSTPATRGTPYMEADEYEESGPLVEPQLEQLLQESPVDRRVDPSRRRPLQSLEPPTAFLDDSVLSRIFRPPSYSFDGTLEMAKTEAAQNGLFLLVSMVSDNFPSHQMNRDTWSNELVREIVKISYLFLQLNSATSAGQKFTALYHVYPPATVIIDPHTGECAETLKGPLGPDDMADKLTSFLESHQLSAGSFIASPSSSLVMQHQDTVLDPSTQPLDYETAFQTAIAASLCTATPAPDVVEDEDEEEILKAAIAASLETLVPPSSIPSVSCSSKPWSPSVDLEQCFPSDAVASAGVTRLMLQLQDGTSHKKMLSVTAPVSALYDLVRQLMSEAQQKPFKLLAGYPPKEVHEDRNCTVSEAGLLNEKVMMAWT